MTQFSVSSSNEQSIYAALELSKNSWILAIQVPGRDMATPANQVANKLCSTDRHWL